MGAVLGCDRGDHTSCLSASNAIRGQSRRMTGHSLLTTEPERAGCPPLAVKCDASHCLEEAAEVVFVPLVTESRNLSSMTLFRCHKAYHGHLKVLESCWTPPWRSSWPWAAAAATA